MGRTVQIYHTMCATKRGGDLPGYQNLEGLAALAENRGVTYNLPMEQSLLQTRLAALGFKHIRYYAQIGSTNDVAAKWAAAGAPDFAVVAADEQSAGRGRAGRTWFTPPGAALAFSVVLHPTPQETGAILPRVSALGALALSDALRQQYGLRPAIKWPNDVLLHGKKAAGILAEAHWSGEALGALILGIGVNVAPEAVPQGTDFPATCVEAAAGRPVDRVALLCGILSALRDRRALLPTSAFIAAWERRLAFREQPVQIKPGDGTPVRGHILGLTPAGHLRLRTATGSEVVFSAGEVRLRPISE